MAHSLLLATAPAATNSSIQLVSPPIVYLGTLSTTPIIFLGAVPSSSTYAALTQSDCQTSHLVAITAITVAAPELSSPAVAIGSYRVCYSTTGSSGNWVIQEPSPGTFVTLQVAPNPTGNSTAPTTQNETALIGGIVGGVLGLLLLLLAVFLAVFFYRKSKRQGKFEIFAAMEPRSEPSFISPNPIFESSAMYESTTKDPFKK